MRSVCFVLEVEDKTSLTDDDPDAIWDLLRAGRAAHVLADLLRTTDPDDHDYVVTLGMR
jgi:hypothetical protein